MAFGTIAASRSAALALAITALLLFASCGGGRREKAGTKKTTPAFGSDTSASARKERVEKLKSLGYVQ